MVAANRASLSVLFVHNGTPYEQHIRHLINAGLHVSEAHGDSAVSEATNSQPDVIVLDFDCNGDVVTRLKNDPMTSDIPIIALAEFGRPERG